MKKLILAISGVFCLQLGFIAYFSNDPTAETSFVVIDDRISNSLLVSSVAEPFNDDQVLPDLELETSVDFPDASALENPNEREPLYTVATSVRRSRVGKSTKTRKPLNTFVSLENPSALKPVNVTYKVHNGVEFKQYQTPRSRTEYPVAKASDREIKTYETVAKTVTQPRKKNLFVRVVTKPYDWLKAFGSTFK